MLLFMTTLMAIVTSRENQQYIQSDSKFYFLIQPRFYFILDRRKVKFMAEYKLK